MDDLPQPRPWWQRLWLIWALLAPALIIGLAKLVTGGDVPVPVVAAGPLSVLREVDAPEGASFELHVHERESPPRTRARFDEVLSGYPSVVVVALDPASLLEDTRAARTGLETLATRTENAFGVPVVVGFVATDEGGGTTRCTSALRPSS